MQIHGIGRLVNCDTNVLDLIFPLLHEQIQLSDEENGGAPDIEEKPSATPFKTGFNSLRVRCRLSVERLRKECWHSN